MASAEWDPTSHNYFRESEQEERVAFNKRRLRRAQAKNAELGCFVVHQPRRGEVGG